ncbi:MAG: hypothetical protein Q4F88_07105 [Eubacteriales bacterium]|nr:hypothetical protein [Eubacteriales bacterium]
MSRTDRQENKIIECAEMGTFSIILVLFSKEIKRLIKMGFYVEPLTSIVTSNAVPCIVSWAEAYKRTGISACMADFIKYNDCQLPQTEIQNLAQRAFVKAVMVCK